VLGPHLIKEVIMGNTELSWEKGYSSLWSKSEESVCLFPGNPHSLFLTAQESRVGNDTYICYKIYYRGELIAEEKCDSLIEAKFQAEKRAIDLITLHLIA